MCSFGGLPSPHQGTNRTQRGPGSVTHYWAHQASTGELHNQYTCTYASTIIHHIHLVRIHIIYMHLCSSFIYTCTFIASSSFIYTLSQNNTANSLHIPEVHMFTQWTTKSTPRNQWDSMTKKSEILLGQLAESGKVTSL